MEEKAHEIKNRFWSISHPRNLHKLFPIPHHYSQNHGFTIIELLIVMILFGVLAGGLIVLIDPITQLEKGRDAERKSDLKKVQAALELFYADKGGYPCYGSNGCGWAKLTGAQINDNQISYLDEIPEGPKGDVACSTDPYFGYVYSVSPDASKYTIFTNLENSNDNDALSIKSPPSVCPEGSRDSWCSSDNITASWSAPSGSSCTGTYNYWVNSQ